MKVTVLQRNILWAEPSENVAGADEAIGRNPGSDLYILPEMFSTGFCTQPEGIAESADSDTLAWMKMKAAQIDAAIPTTSPMRPQVRITLVEPSAMCDTEIFLPAMNIFAISLE